MRIESDGPSREFNGAREIAFIMRDERLKLERGWMIRLRLEHLTAKLPGSRKAAGLAMALGNGEDIGQRIGSACHLRELRLYRARQRQSGANLTERQEIRSEQSTDLAKKLYYEQANSRQCVVAIERQVRYSTIQSVREEKGSLGQASFALPFLLDVPEDGETVRHA